MNRIHLMTSAAASLLALAAGGAAHAQDNAVATAEDAFGERVGVEQVGLYDEGQSRGFDLQGPSAYRIEGNYFVRAVYLPDPLVEGVSVRVGVNAARLDYPSPSGVVNYRLRSPGAENGLVISAGMRPYETPFLDVRGNLVSEDGKFGLVASALMRPDITWANGSTGEGYDYALVGQWRPSEQFRARVFGSYITRDYQGDYGTLAAGDGLPPSLPAGVDFSPRWSQGLQEAVNTGVLVDGRVGDWNLSATAFRSAFMLERSDFTVVEAMPDGSATATAFLNPEHEFISDSAELRASRVFAMGPLRHRVSAAVRGRLSHSETGGTQAYDLGAIDLSGRPDYPDGPPRTDDGRRNVGDVQQVTASLGYGFALGDRLETRFGVHRTHYRKEVDPIAGLASESEEEFMLYNASVVWGATDRLTLFGSWVTGLEETGNAPQNAVNRNEVLAPVESEQFEVGMRYAVTDKLNLIAAAFDITKPTYGLRSDGWYAVVGDVRHRGVEASLAGELFTGTNIVLGAVAIDPEVSGELVRNGSIGPEPAGVSKLVAIASVDHRLSWAPGWSVDANLNYQGGRWVDGANTLETDGVLQLGLGARYAFELGDTPAQFRVAVSNLTDERGWWASRSEMLWPVGPRTVRASFTITLQ